MAPKDDSEQMQCPFHPHRGKIRPEWLAEWTGGPGAVGSKSTVRFPLQFHYENTRAQFFVEDSSTAYALKAVNYKIVDQENRRVCTKSPAWLEVGIGAPGTGSWS